MTHHILGFQNCLYKLHRSAYIVVGDGICDILYVVNKLERDYHQQRPDSLRH